MKMVLSEYGRLVLAAVIAGAVLLTFFLFFPRIVERFSAQTEEKSSLLEAVFSETAAKAKEQEENLSLLVKPSLSTGKLYHADDLADVDGSLRILSVSPAAGEELADPKQAVLFSEDSEENSEIVFREKGMYRIRAFYTGDFGGRQILSFYVYVQDGGNL